MGALISPEYVEQNRQLHEQSQFYGYNAKHVGSVRSLMMALRTEDVLDYGCGKKQLERGLGIKINNYDPAVPGCESRPAPAHIVVCNDVLEHVEPECLDAVLADLRYLTLVCLWFHICTVPSGKHLPDGRNSHLIVRPAKWWLQKLEPLFRWRVFPGVDGFVEGVGFCR